MTSSITAGLAEKSMVGEEEEEEEEERKRALKRYREIISRLPKVEGWGAPKYLCEYEGFWMIFQPVLEGIMWVQEQFKPRKQDVLLATLPKSGTTWFKSLLFSIMNRSRYHDFTSTHPLLTTNPHDLVPFIEVYLHQNIPFPNKPDDDAPPRIFHTHIPFASFSEPMLESQCRIVYVCRNPKDVFVSLFYFLQKMRDDQKNNLLPFSIEKAFEKYCDGVFPYGPFWNHVLGYWKASLERSEQVMFLRYEDMKKNPTSLLKRLAKFLGYPFSEEEEKEGAVVNQILELCSFQKLSGLEANKTGAVIIGDTTIKKNTFFRKGEVGDWKRHLTADMANRIDKIIEEKFAGSGLTFLESDHHHHS